ncbi:MAG: hypothetical protein CMA11_07020 [Euryarchaeota archaeon]|nr:hypothetical protein [Euryarchaeota archaeon]
MARKIDHEHVPFAMPEKAHSLVQEWRNLTFMHWEVEPQNLAPHIPKGLEIDLFEGKAYVGAIPFEMRNVRPRLLPSLPGVSTFPEFNIRTYVKKNGIPGVLFLTLDAQSRVTCWHAPRSYGLPYRYAKCSLKITDKEYAWKSRRSSDGVILEGKCKLKGEQRQAEKDSLEYFLFERYSLYTEHKKKLHMAYTLHKPWTFQDGEVEIVENTLTESFNLNIDVMKPQYIHASKGVYVHTWSIEEVNQ